MSGYAPGLLLVLFGRPTYVRDGDWRCVCGAEWYIAASSRGVPDELRRGEGCRWCLRSSASRSHKKVAA